MNNDLMESPADSVVFDRSVTQQRMADYAEASGDHNPLHLDAEFAATTQFGGTIAHGMMLFGYMSDALTHTYGDAWSESGRMRARFRAPTRPGDTVSVTLREQARDVGLDGTMVIRCIVECRSGTGERLATGDAGLTLGATADA